MAGVGRRHLLAAGGACAAALAGCSRPRDGAIRFWAMGREAEVAGALLEPFRRANPQWTVRIEALPWSAAHEKLLTAFAGNALPDVAQMGNTWLPEFVALGALQPLDERVAADTSLAAPRDWFDGIWQTNVVNGALWALPWYVDTRLLFYRRDLLAQAGHRSPPRDWGQWMAALRDVKRQAGPNNYAILLPLNEYDPLIALALQQDAPMLREGGRYGNFRGADFRRAWDFMLQMYRDKLAPAASDTEVANVWSEFARGYYSFYISGPWQIGEFRRRLPASVQSAWATAPLPGPAGPGASTAGGSSLAIFRGARESEGAWALMRYLAQPQVQQQFHAMTGNLPPRRSTWQQARLMDDAPTRAFGEQLERVRPVPQVPEWERIATEMRVVLEKVVHGDMPAERGPDELDARADRILEKRRWMLARHGT